MAAFFMAQVGRPVNAGARDNAIAAQVIGGAGEALNVQMSSPEQAASEQGDERVYFIEGAGGAIKIGRSTNVARRFASLQTSSAEPLRVLAEVPGGAVLEMRAPWRRTSGVVDPPVRCRQCDREFYRDARVTHICAAEDLRGGK